MHDIRSIRENPAAFDAALSRRNLPAMSSDLLALDEARRAAIHGAETAQAAQNAASKEAGAAKGARRRGRIQPPARPGDREKGRNSAPWRRGLGLWTPASGMPSMRIPNLPLDEVPSGRDENDNVEIRRWGNPRNFDFAPKEHFEIKGVVPGMDFETAAKLSGARFVVLKGAVIRVHRALAQFMLDTHIEDHGLTEMWTPVLVKEEAMYGTNQLPKFAEDSYQTTNGWWLIPTSEVTLTNSVAGDILDDGQLPRRMTAHTPVLPLRGRVCGQGHHGHAAPAPVRKGRDGDDLHPGHRHGRTRTHDEMRRGYPGKAGHPLPHHRSLHRRHGLWRAKDP